MKNCMECEVNPSLQRTIRPCLSCLVSLDMDNRSHENPSLPWSSYAEDQKKADDRNAAVGLLMRQKSVQKIIRQNDMRKQRKLKRLVAKHGACNVTHNMKMSHIKRFITDIFTTVIDLRWRWMLVFFSLAYLSGWIGFGGFWYCLAWLHGDLGYLSRNDVSFDFKPCVANVDSFIGAFLFSIETQTTIGYGSRSVTEECWLGPTLVMFQSVFSALVDAILVGCVFVKIARPKKRAATLKFSHNAVIAMRDGELCFMFRMGNIRNSHIFGAEIRAKLVRPLITPEKECIPLYSYFMDVGESTGENSILLVWPLIICHVIDKTSPLYHYSHSDLKENTFEIIVYLEGIVEETGLLVQARTSYLPSEIKWGHRFSSHVVSMPDSEDNLRIDYSQFNTTYAVSNTPCCSASQLDRLKKSNQSVTPTVCINHDKADDAQNGHIQKFEIAYGSKEDHKWRNGIPKRIRNKSISHPPTPTVTGIVNETYNWDASHL